MFATNSIWQRRASRQLLVPKLTQCELQHCKLASYCAGMQLARKHNTGGHVHYNAIRCKSMQTNSMQCSTNHYEAP